MMMIVAIVLLKKHPCRKLLFFQQDNHQSSIINSFWFMAYQAITLVVEFARVPLSLRLSLR